MRPRINCEHMLNGVTIMNPAVTYIEADAQIGKDTIIFPNTYIQGKTVIGERNQIGPNSHIHDSKIGNDCKVFMSVMEGAVMEDDVDIGPFARLRKGAHLAKHVHMGNFGEVKDFVSCRRSQDGTFLLHWQCDHRREYQYWRGNNYMQLRWRE